MMNPREARRPRKPEEMLDPWVAWLQRVREDAREHLPQVTPRMRFEIKRKSIHVVGAVVAVAVLAFIQSRGQLVTGVGVGLFGIVVITLVHFAKKRKMHVDHPILQVVHDPISRALDETRRPGEDYPWSPVAFIAALLIVGLAVDWRGLPYAFSYAAFGILGVGDAASALIGVAYGKRKLPWNRDKSLEGTLAGVTAAFVAATVLASVDFSLRGDLFPVQWFLVAAVGAVAGALVETLPRAQDNFFVPVAALAAMYAAAGAFGLA